LTRLFLTATARFFLGQTNPFRLKARLFFGGAALLFLGAAFQFRRRFGLLYQGPGSLDPDGWLGYPQHGS